MPESLALQHQAVGLAIGDCVNGGRIADGHLADCKATSANMYDSLPTAFRAEQACGKHCQGRLRGKPPACIWFKKTLA
jgi:hypothetical protein